MILKKVKDLVLLGFLIVVFLSNRELFGQRSGSTSNEWKVSGNQNTDSTNFIGTTGFEPLQFKTNGKLRLAIAPSGKIVLPDFVPGTSSRALMVNPNGALEVALSPGQGGNGDCSGLLWNGAGNLISPGCFLGTTNQEDLVIKTAGYEKMRVTVSGKVGIIQPQPLGQLHIGQLFPLIYSHRVDHNTLGFNCYWDDSNGILGPFRQVNSGPSAMINFIDNRSLLHMAVNSDAGAGQNITGPERGIYISEQGFNGINTSTPAAALHVGGKGIYEDSVTVAHWLGVNGTMSVQGQVTSEAVRVDLNIPWPDYVFESTYDLISLEELKSYIEMNGHLPDLPAAEEVEQKGLDLGETNAILVRKVEELTLYILELKSELDELKKHIEE